MRKLIIAGILSILSVTARAGITSIPFSIKQASMTITNVYVTTQTWADGSTSTTAASGGSFDGGTVTNYTNFLSSVNVRDTLVLMDSPLAFPVQNGLQFESSGLSANTNWGMWYLPSLGRMAIGESGNNFKMELGTNTFTGYNSFTAATPYSTPIDIAGYQSQLVPLTKWRYYNMGYHTGAVIDPVGRLGIGTETPATGIHISSESLTIDGPSPAGYSITASSGIHLMGGGIVWQDGSISTCAASGGSVGGGLVATDSPTVTGAWTFGQGPIISTTSSIYRDDIAFYSGGTLGTGNAYLGKRSKVYGSYTGSITTGEDNSIQASNCAAVGEGTTCGAVGAMAGGSGGSAYGVYAFSWSRNGGAAGTRAFLAGGYGGQASGSDSFASGVGPAATHDGSRVFADASGDGLASIKVNEFAVQAGGGVRVVGPEIYISSITASTANFGILGAFDTLPTSTYSKGRLAYQTIDNTISYSTEAVASAGSWRTLVTNPIKQSVEWNNADFILTSTNAWYTTTSTATYYGRATWDGAVSSATNKVYLDFYTPANTVNGYFSCAMSIRQTAVDASSQSYIVQYASVTTGASMAALTYTGLTRVNMANVTGGDNVSMQSAVTTLSWALVPNTHYSIAIARDGDSATYDPSSVRSAFGKFVLNYAVTAQ